MSFGTIQFAQCQGARQVIAVLGNNLNSIILSTAPTKSEKVESPLVLTAIGKAVVREFAVVETERFLVH